MNYFIILVLIVLFIMLSNLRAENDKLKQDKEIHCSSPIILYAISNPSFSIFLAADGKFL